MRTPTPQVVVFTALAAVLCPLNVGRAVLSGSASALAATPAEEADALIARSNDLRSAGDDQGALPLLQKAVRVHPSPRTFAQLGLVEKALGRWAEADEHLTEALKSFRDPWIQKNIKVLEPTLAETKRNVGRVEITGEPDGAEVLVNGRSVGKVPLAHPVRVSAGTVDIELRAPGYQRALRTLAVAGMQYQPVVVRLERESSARAEPLTTVPEAGLRGASTDPGPEPWRRWAVGGALGGSAVGVGLGVLGLFRHNSGVNKFNRLGCFVSDGKFNRENSTDLGPCREAKADYENARTLSIVGFSSGAALGIAALVLHLTTPDGDSSEPRMARASCAPDLANPGLACAVRF